MNTKHFLGLTFYPENSFAKTIQRFRARFDDKFHSNPDLFLPIVAPFEVGVGELKPLKLELVEELESFFYDNTQNHRMTFTGIDVQEHKKNKLLFLNPSIEEELSLCQESLFSICQSYNAEREKKLKDKKTFLTIGRFQDTFELHSAIREAQRDFHEFTTLPYQSICLFTKNNGIWYREADLVTFDRPADKFLQTSVIHV